MTYDCLHGTRGVASAGGGACDAATRHHIYIYTHGVTVIMTHIGRLVTPLVATHEPPSRPSTLYPYRIPKDPFKGTLKGTPT